MSQQQDGMAIAREQIAKEAGEQTGFLDLGKLGLTIFPEELFQLLHLRTLSLGSYYFDEAGEFCEAVGSMERNDLQRELELLARLPCLESLHLRDLSLNDLSPLAALAKLQLLVCSGMQVTDLTPLSGLASLQSLDCSETQVTDLTPLVKLANLQTMNCGETQVTDLSPLSGLVNLQTVNFGDTQVTDLSPLSGLVNLQTVVCFNTQVTDLTPLDKLANLQTVNCGETQVSDLTPLSGLVNLQLLICYNTQVTDLTPLVKLTNLRSVYCFNTQVTDLTPLAKLTNLQLLDCSRLHVTDLTPLSGLVNLQSLECSGTQVTDLTPLSGLASLQTVDFSDTLVTDLTPLSGLINLQSLNCSGTQISDLSPLLTLPKLRNLYAHEVRIHGIPDEVLSQEPFDNCLERLRAHFADLCAGAATVSDLKLIVLGNGRVGKTQLCRQLRGEAYDDAIPSTHGINVTSTVLPATNDAAATTLHIWDFGGQDIYHGTHALFMRTRAIFLLAWANVAENRATHEHGGFTFRNHPLPYWLAYVRHLGGVDSPLLVVQTQCDHTQDDARRLPVADETLDGFGHCKPICTSALKSGADGWPWMKRCKRRWRGWGKNRGVFRSAPGACGCNVGWRNCATRTPVCRLPSGNTGP